MLEKKYLLKIMKEYNALLKKYEEKIENFSTLDMKKLIGEVKVFWYCYQKYIEYFISNIEKEDDVVYLAGAVKLDIINKGHLEFIIAGKYRIINEPILKMSRFYNFAEDNIDFNYVNKYLKECISDLMVLFEEYDNDFYILPIEPITSLDCQEYYKALSNISEELVLSLFSEKYVSVANIFEESNSYEDVESKLKQNINKYLIFNSLDDYKLTLREKCTNYLKENGNFITMIKDTSESYIFYILITQYFMQAMAIINLMLNCNIMPFIRNDITFHYFSLIYNSNVVEELSSNDYLYVYIPYIIQKTIDFSDKNYKNIREKVGNGKMVKYIIERIGEERVPSIIEIEAMASDFMNQVIV